MPFLWSGNQKQLLTNLKMNRKKPSPTNHKQSPDSARDPEISWSDRKRSSCLFRYIERVSLSVSQNLAGLVFKKQIGAGMTVEACLLLPLFLFFFVNMGCAIEMIRLHGNLQFSLWQLGSRMSLYGYVVHSGEEPEEGNQEPGWWGDMAGMLLASTYIKARLIDLTGREYLDHSPLRKGAEGLELWESDIFGEEDEIDIVVTYTVSPWNSLAGFFFFRMANRYSAHIWNGYGLPLEEESVRVVYVTENASVYHEDRNCSYLQLSIRQIPWAEADRWKNSSGRAYEPCQKCGGENISMFCYVTDQGRRFHSMVDCPGLKRTVSAVALGQSGAVRPCSRCGHKSL